MSTIDIRNEISLTDGTFRIIGAAGSMYRLVNQATGVETSEHQADVFSRLVEVPAWPTHSARELDTLEAGERAFVELWAAHIEEMVTGERPGHNTPRPEYDPELTNLNERVQTKIVQLRNEGKPASRSALLRKKALWEIGGTAALIDRRLFKHIGKLDQADSRVIDAIAEVIADAADRSTVTQSYLHLQVRKILVGRMDATEIPSKASFYRYFEAMDAGKYTTGKATTRRSAANTPDRRYGTTRTLLPGDEVQVDSTPMDVLVRVKGIKGGVRPTLTIMVDKATRSIIATTLRLDASKGYDHALLLAQAIVPSPNRPERNIHRALLAARHPEHVLLDSDEKARLESVRPYIYPRRIVTDNGRDYLSSVFTSACKKFGIDITMSANYTPTDKPIVERTFQSINTLFTQQLPGYVGNHTVNRGRKVEDDNLLDIFTLAELLDDWVAKVWQNRKHESLRDPFDPSVTYSPNQVYNGAAMISGVAAYPLTREDFIDLLPTTYRSIGSAGVQFNNRHFDSDLLKPLRHVGSQNKRSAHKWEVKYNPYDHTHVWVRSNEGTWIECRWREGDVVNSPHFSDIANATREAARNEAATHDAQRTGTKMPTGTQPAIAPTTAATSKIDEARTGKHRGSATDAVIDSDPAINVEDFADFDFEEN
jgi:putative transposase